MSTCLNDSQKNCFAMQDILIAAEVESGIWSFVATTSKEQREIAKYIKDVYPSFRIIDCSKKEESIMFNSVNDIEEEKIIIINFQDLFLAPYGDTDEETTVTLDDKIEWFSKIENPLYRNEAFLLERINFIRDSFFSKFGKRNCIIGMSPMLFNRLHSPLYYPHWPDLESFVQAPYFFNREDTFIRSSDKYNDYFNNVDKGEDDFTGKKIYYSDMIFVWNGKVVRLPSLYQYLYYGRLDENKEDLIIESLNKAPELVFPQKKVKVNR